ncbi:cupin domain-containing protein [Streptomyces niger]|uniref:cupin domain-containing protein n=1 Tax=Streptomyces niger TaxID=66373 RepID=UPI00069A9E1C|nr:cupin domain-containing protein [Streptomyces niger]
MDETTPAELAERYGLRPLPAEGGLFRQTWAGPPDATGRPVGTAILVLLTTADDGFSTLHRLPVDEVWHCYRGDAAELLLLGSDGADRVVRLGGDGGEVQTVVPAGTWMGARVLPGGRWSLCGTTMAPGFLPSDYEGGDVDDLTRQYPRQAARIRALSRPGAPLRMPDGTPGAADDA